MLAQFSRLEVMGGRVESGPPLRLVLPSCVGGYGDAQVYDYGRPPGRRSFPYRPGIHLHARVRFSHDADKLLGTAGFGFWNAPFGDPTMPWPTVPQAAWFFFASPPNNLPFAPPAGAGWFASTINAATLPAISLIPAAPLVLLLNQVTAVRRLLWPWVRHRLQIAAQPVPGNMTDWHTYDLEWHASGCQFRVDGQLLLKTTASPRGPLGFVCWLDNQYLVATANGRFRWGTLPTHQTQWLEISDLSLKRTSPL